jgi:hypothetical protein
MTATPPSPGLDQFKTQLHDALLDVLRQEPIQRPANRRAGLRRPPRLALAAAAAAVTIAAAIGFTVGPALVDPSRQTAQAFALERLGDGRIKVSFTRDFDDGQALQARLRAAGVDVTVETEAVTPCHIGKVIGWGYMIGGGHTDVPPAGDIPQRVIPQRVPAPAATPGSAATPGPAQGRIGTPQVPDRPYVQDTPDGFVIDPSVPNAHFDLTIGARPAPGKTYDPGWAAEAADCAARTGQTGTTP